MVKKLYIPEQGDIVYFDFSPTRGKEQAGSRPGLVLSRAFFNKASSVALVAPITSKQKGYPFEVLLDSKKISGVALIDQVRAVDYEARGLKRVSSASESAIEEAKDKFIKLVQ
jgi:mRNA interferase MazF